MVIVGFIFIFMGSVLGITIVGLPPGIALDLIGFLLILDGVTGGKQTAKALKA